MKAANGKTCLTGQISSKSTFSKGSTAKPTKPEIDLESWSKLGGTSLLHRTPRKSGLDAWPDMTKFWFAVRNLIPAGLAQFLINRLGLLEA